MFYCENQANPLCISMYPIPMSNIGFDDMVPQQMSLQGFLNVLFDMFGYFWMLAGGIYSNPSKNKMHFAALKILHAFRSHGGSPRDASSSLVCELPEIAELAEAGTLWLWLT